MAVKTKGEVKSSNGKSAEDLGTHVITLTELTLRDTTVRIAGQTPLIVSRLAPEFLEDRPVDPETGKAIPFTPQEIAQLCRYRTPDGRDAFPAGGIMKAIARAGARFLDVDMVQTRGVVNIRAEMIALETISGPQYRKDTGKNRTGGAILIHRTFYADWAMEIPVTYWTKHIDAKTLISLFQFAGHAIGLGAWRVEKGGTFGRFTVANPR